VVKTKIKKKNSFILPASKKWLLKNKKMKILLPLFVIILSLFKADAQSISMEAISSGGDSYTNSASRLSFTGGQVMSGTYKNTSNTLIEGFQQQYYTYWVGDTSSSWIHQRNWSGGPVPGPHNDIILLPGKPFYPVINLNTSCRSLTARPGTSVTVSPGFTLIITN
jgi:hypothetical protein